MNGEVDKEKWSMYIERVDNGYLVYLNYGDVEVPRIKQVFQDSEIDDLASFEDVLSVAQEHFALLGSRHDKERLVIRREPGDKYEDHLEVPPSSNDESENEVPFK